MISIDVFNSDKKITTLIFPAEELFEKSSSYKKYVDDLIKSFGIIKTIGRIDGDSMPPASEARTRNQNYALCVEGGTNGNSKIIFDISDKRGIITTLIVDVTDAFDYHEKYEKFAESMRKQYGYITIRARREFNSKKEKWNKKYSFE